IERLALSLELEGIDAREQPLDVFLVSDDDAARGDVLVTLATLRAAGISCDADYAGRSMKGQLSYAQKRAAAVAVPTAEGWPVRRRGEQDRTGPDLKELL